MTQPSIPLAVSNKKHYRLGDLILQREKRDLLFTDKWNQSPGRESETLAEATKRIWPNSLASQYIKETDVEGDVDVLSKLVSNYPTTYPHANCAVLHIRIGDVIDDVPKRKAVDFWTRPTSIYEGDPYRLFYPSWSYYVLCESQIREVLEKIKRYGISSVKLVYGVHTEGEFPQSKEYIRLCACLFQKEGFSVELVSHADADEAFAYMCNANTFFSTGGGFGKLVGQIVEHRGGVFIQRKEESALSHKPGYPFYAIVGFLITLVVGLLIWKYMLSCGVGPQFDLATPQSRMRSM